MFSIISCILHVCRSGATASAINVTSIPKKSGWPRSSLFSDTSKSNCLVIASKLCTDKSNSSKNITEKKDSKSQNCQNTTNGSTELEKPQDTFFTNDPAFGNKDNKGLAAGSRPYFNPEESEDNLIQDYELQPPSNCCMSGCPNCVWLEYVEKLTKIYTNPELTREKILKELDKMEDQNIKAFIMMELRTKKLI